MGALTLVKYMGGGSNTAPHVLFTLIPQRALKMTFQRKLSMCLVF
jgi:hypothetical protein